MIVIAPNNHLGMAYHHHHSLEHAAQYAWDHFTKALEINPAHSQAMAALADILKNKKQGYESAIQYYNQAIQIEADNAKYYLERGECFDALKQYNAALADYAQAIALRPDDWQPYNRRGELYMALQRWTEARRDYQNYREYAHQRVRTPVLSLQKNVAGGPYVEFYFAENADGHEFWNPDSWYPTFRLP